MHSVAITGIVITPFLAIVWAIEKIRTRVSIAMSKAWPYVSAFCTAKRDSRAALLCGSEQRRLPTAALAALQLKDSIF